MEEKEIIKKKQGTKTPQEIIHPAQPRSRRGQRRAAAARGKLRRTRPAPARRVRQARPAGPGRRRAAPPTPPCRGAAQPRGLPPPLRPPRDKATRGSGPGASPRPGRSSPHRPVGRSSSPHDDPLALHVHLVEGELVGERHVCYRRALL